MTHGHASRPTWSATRARCLCSSSPQERSCGCRQVSIFILDGYTQQSDVIATTSTHARARTHARIRTHAHTHAHLLTQTDRHTHTHTRCERRGAAADDAVPRSYFFAFFWGICRPVLAFRAESRQVPVRGYTSPSICALCSTQMMGHVTHSDWSRDPGDTVTGTCTAAAADTGTDRHRHRQTRAQTDTGTNQ
jgi:hypothetical protein